jgi:aerobic-type carbon monoxide dehydrogenase small subunit (CoxS/CutS family)
MRLLPIRADHGDRLVPQTVPNPTDAEIDANITNICRCGTYERLRRAIHRAADLMKA